MGNRDPKRTERRAKKPNRKEWRRRREHIEWLERWYGKGNVYRHNHQLFVRMR